MTIMGPILNKSPYSFYGEFKDSRFIEEEEADEIRSRFRFFPLLPPDDSNPARISFLPFIIAGPNSDGCWLTIGSSNAKSWLLSVFDCLSNLFDASRFSLPCPSLFQNGGLPISLRARNHDGSLRHPLPTSERSTRENHRPTKQLVRKRIKLRRWSVLGGSCFCCARETGQEGGSKDAMVSIWL